MYLIKYEDTTLIEGEALRHFKDITEATIVDVQDNNMPDNFMVTC